MLDRRSGKEGLAMDPTSEGDQVLRNNYLDIEKTPKSPVCMHTRSSVPDLSEDDRSCHPIPLRGYHQAADGPSV